MEALLSNFKSLASASFRSTGRDNLPKFTFSRVNLPDRNSNHGGAHLQGDPGILECKIRIVKRHMASFLGDLNNLLNGPGNQKAIVISTFVILFSCLLFLLFGRSKQRPDTPVVEGMDSTRLSIAPAVTTTKWWIKLTATSPSVVLDPTAPAEVTRPSANNCPSSFALSLHSGMYAFVSLTPPLPNRIRSGAGKSNSYLGQIQPGDGLRVLDGPLCADGFSWWFVESIQGGLKGWTVEGRASEQWIIPCPDQTIGCHKKLMPAPSISNTPSPTAQDEGKQKNNCRSDKLAVGILAQVEQDSLLILRSGPNSDTVIGRIGPLSIMNVVDGPACTGSTVWWKVKPIALHLLGWATENNLHVCSKEDECS